MELVDALFSDRRGRVYRLERGQRAGNPRSRRVVVDELSSGKAENLARVKGNIEFMQHSIRIWTRCVRRAAAWTT